MQGWRLTLLGGFELRATDGSFAALKSRKGAALLAYLALQPRRTATRDSIAGLLWERVDDEAARVSLRQLLAAIRKAEGDHGALVQSEGGALRLSPLVHVDVEAFESAAAGKDADAAGLYGGEFLAGFNLKEEPAFEEWAAIERARLRGLAVAALELAVEAGAHSPDGGLQAALRLVQMEPLHERGHRALMRLHVRQGRPAAALKAYQGLADLLQRELGVAPEPETRELYERIRSERAHAERAAPPAAPVAIVAEAPAARPIERVEPVIAAPAPAPVEPEETVRPKRRGRVALAVGAVVVLALVAAGLWMFIGRPVGRPPEVQKIFPVAVQPALEQRPALSPDGARVVYTARLAEKGNVDLYLASIGDATPLRLTRNPAIDDNAAWTPDGSAVAFTRSSHDGRTPCEILVMTVPNGAERSVGHCRSALSSRLSWGPDGKWLAFSDAPTAGAPSRIYRLDVATGTAVPLTSPAPNISGDTEPAVSRDGRTLAYIRTAAWQSTELEILDLASRRTRTLTHDGKTVWGLAWAKDDAGVIFTSDRAGDTGLWWASVDGRQIARLAAGAIEFRAISHARDRDRLMAEVQKDKASFYELPADATPATAPRLIERLKTDLFDRFYNEDAQGDVVFVSVRSGDEQLWMAPAGQPPRQLTQSDGWFYQEPVWSPDGRWIAFIGVHAGQADVYLLDSQGGAPRALTDDQAVEQAPAWSPDGRFLYVNSRRSGAWRVWRMDPFAAKPVLAAVTGDGPRTARPSPDGRFLYYVLDGRPGVRRQALTADGAAVTGPEEMIAPDLHPTDWRNWWVTKDALFYARRGGGDPSGVIRRHDLATGAERDMADATDLLWSASFWARPDGSLVLTRRELSIDLSGIDFESRP